MLKQSKDLQKNNFALSTKTGDEKVEYLYIDIYGEESKWSSNIFYTQGKDTSFLKEYVGQKVAVSGIFAAESHGIPYIKDIIIK